MPPEDRERNPTYWSICQAVATNDLALELSDLVPPPQFRVNVFLAAVHHLLLGGAPHSLATRYRSVCERRGLGYRAVDDDTLAAELAAFCEEFRDPIAERCATRSTQTNEVGRCAVVRSVLGRLAASGVREVALVDLGCSAGLNLFVDAYGYDLGGHLVGTKDARPRLRCELRGALPPLGAPQIVARVGVDLAPVDVADDDGVAWLLACLWPDNLERFDRLGAAIDVAAARRGELTLVRGDMVDGLAGAASLAEGAEHVVVMNCWSAAYLPPERRSALTAAFGELAAGRSASWVLMEHPHVARDLGMLPDDAELRFPGSSTVSLASRSAGGIAVELLAETHHHGLWLDWR